MLVISDEEMGFLRRFCMCPAAISASERAAMGTYIEDVALVEPPSKN